MTTSFVSTKEPMFREKLYKLKRNWRVALIILIIGFAANLTFSLLTTERSTLSSIKSFEPAILLLAILFIIIPWITNTLRVLVWTRFLRHSFSFFQIFKIILSSDIGAAVTPTAVGGGYVKAGMLMQKGFSAGAAASLMTLGSFEDAIFFLIAIPSAAIYTSCWKLNVFQNLKHGVHIGNNWLVIISALILLAGFPVFIHLTRKSKRPFSMITRIIQHLGRAWQDFIQVYAMIGSSGKSRFLLTMPLTAIQWFCRYSILSILLYSLNIPADPVLIFLLQWITFTLMTFIPTPGAIAGAEASFYFIYSLLIPNNLIGLITAGWRFLTFYLNVFLGLMILSITLVIKIAKLK